MLRAAVILVLVPAVAAAAPPISDPPNAFLDRTGFNELLISNTVFGLFAGGLLGVAVTEDPEEVIQDEDNLDQFETQRRLDDLQDERAARTAAGVLIGGGLSIGLTLLLNRGNEVPTADVVLQRQLWLWGVSAGSAIGRGTQSSDRVGALLSLALGSAGFGAGLVANDYLQRNPGEAGLAGSGLGWGAALPALIAYAATVNEGDDLKDRAPAWAGLLGGTLGLAGVLAWHPGTAVSRYRVFWVDVGGVVGILVGAGLGVFVSPDSEVAPPLGAAVGLGGGLALAWFLTSDLSEPTLESAPGSAALLSLKDGELALGMPIPEIGPVAGDERGWQARLRLVEGTW